MQNISLLLFSSRDQKSKISESESSINLRTSLCHLVMFSLAAQCGLAGQCFQHEKDYDFRPKITKFGPYWHFRPIIGPPGPFGAIPDQNGGVFFSKGSTTTCSTYSQNYDFGPKASVLHVNDHFQIFPPEGNVGLLTLTNCLRHVGCPYNRASTYDGDDLGVGDF